MMNTLRVKLALTAALVAVALIQWPRMLYPTVAASIVLFGVANIFLTYPGTAHVRAVSLGCAYLGLLLPPMQLLITLGAWLLWVPSFFAAIVLARPNEPTDVMEQEPSALAPKITVSALITAVAIGSIAYRLLVTRHLEQTAALFIGLPAVMAIVVVYFVSPRSAAGVACKAVALGLLVSLMLLWEGVLCVLMAAPLFFAVAILVAKGMEFAERGGDQRRLFSCLVVLAIVPLAFEGVTPLTTIARDETIVASRVVAASEDAVARALFEPPRFDRVPSRYLRAGFPSPTVTRIERRDDRTRWIVQIRGGEMRINGMEPRTGELVLELVEHRRGFLRWRVVSDSSHMTHFLMWREASVRWDNLDDRSTRVTWTLKYQRGLDPAWYFGPLERFVVGIAVDYLIETVAKP